MTTLGARNLTLLDITRRQDKDGKVMPIIELLNQKHELLDDANVVVCNDGTTHKTTIRPGLPDVTWRKFYKGVPSGKSSTAQVVDACGMLRALPQVDAELVDMSEDKSGVMLSEVAPHLEALRQEVESTIIYGDQSVDPEKFHGLDQRYNVKDGTDETLSSYNVIGCGGSQSDNTDVWLIGWGDNATSLIVPASSPAGIVQKAPVKQYVADADGNMYPVYLTEYGWNLGLTVRDWRANGRLCNIDVSALKAGTGTIDMVTKMIQLKEQVQDLAGNVARWSWLMNPVARTALRTQILGKSNVNLTFDTVEGRRVLAFDDIPIRTSRKVLLTQTAI
jgi:hypothetical protein